MKDTLVSYCIAVIATNSEWKIKCCSLTGKYFICRHITAGNQHSPPSPLKNNYSSARASNATRVRRVWTLISECTSFMSCIRHHCRQDILLPALGQEAQTLGALGFSQSMLISQNMLPHKSKFADNFPSIFSLLGSGRSTNKLSLRNMAYTASYLSTRIV